MPEEKFDPIKEFTSIRDNLSRAFEQSMRGLATGMYPLMDIYETADAIIVRTSPIDGVVASSLEVSMENGVLIIQGETVPETDMPEGAVILARERKFGAFSRGIRIPRDVKADEAQAKFKNGMLTITIPKIADTRPQIIDVVPAE